MGQGFAGHRLGQGFARNATPLLGLALPTAGAVPATNKGDSNAKQDQDQGQGKRQARQDQG